MLTKVADYENNNTYSCENCDYNTSRKSSFDKHLLTAKHSVNATFNTKVAKSCKNIFYTCELCDKKYKSRVGLWKHNKSCNQMPVKKDDPSNKELIMLLIKENSELRKEQTDIKELILEIVKNGCINTNTNNSHNNITNNNTNSHNKAFNLNFFLNETCKNAMNITDFINSIKPQLSDLIEVGEIGYVEGISKIIVKSLNNLDETIRPIHCTDKKRETFYVKDQGQWEKEDEQQKKIKKIIKNVANKNIDLLPQFREKYPEYINSSSKISDKYDKMVVEVMETDPEKDNKIIRNISKVATISH
jgi:hypothetical protein